MCVAQLLRAALLGLTALLSACALFGSDEGGDCSPACGAGLSCVDGLCQPIRCSAAEDCSDDFLCFEGRCVYSCDGAGPCPSRECSEGLCVGTMECRQGDVRSCESACGEGVERCVESLWSTCSVAGPEPTDRCGDGEDNDCDGQAEEGCPLCDEGELKSCESACGVGEQRCEGGAWSPCSVSPPDAAGVCPCEEGSVERCDSPCGEGQAICEEGTFGRCLYEGSFCECEPGAIAPCDAGCGSGSQRCEGGQWSACRGPEPREELCFNQLDDDCDQQLDEGCAEECTARPRNQNDYFTSVTDDRQSVPLVSSGTRVWLSWATASNAYVQGASFEDRQTVKTDRVIMPIRQVEDLSSLGGSGGVGHLSIDPQDQLHLSFVSSSGLSTSVAFNPPGSVWEAKLVGDDQNQQLIYRTSELYLQRYSKSQPSDRPAPLRLTTRINHLGYDVTRGGGRVSIFYQDDSGDLDEGRVLSMVQTDDRGEALLGERAIVDSLTGEPLLTSGPPSVIFKENQHLVAYPQHSQGLNYIKTALLSLDGEVLSGPHTLLEADMGTIPQALELAATEGRRALVWYERATTSELTKVRYLELDEQGLPSSQIHMLARGQLRVFPHVTYDLNGYPNVSWVQTDVDPEFGGVFHTLRLAQFDHEPGCW